jgi:dienelactone hydrolase
VNLAPGVANTGAGYGPGLRVEAPCRRVGEDCATRYDRLIFSTATAVIVLHVLVDAFVAPEPGVPRDDHLLAGLVPTAVALAAIAIYPRLRPGLRAAVALTFGVLALVGGSIAVVHAAAGGPSGDDWTGFLLLPAGLALCTLGVALLWRSRKPGGRRYVRRALIVVLAAVFAYEVVLAIGLAIVVTHKPRTTTEAADLGRPYREVTLRTTDGLDLAAWYVPSRNRTAVIAFPGRDQPVPHARMLVRHGYGVLLLDRRGEGDSDGDPNLLGWDGERDVDAALAYLTRRPDVDPNRIGGLGLSVGGELLLRVAARNDALHAVVSEGAGAPSVREDLELPHQSKWLHLPNDAMTTLATLVLSGDRPPPSLKKLVPRIAPRPVFLIYAEHGQGGEELNPTYYRAAGEPKLLWKLPEAEHTGGLDSRPDEYERRVVAFFDRALGVTSEP